MNKSTHGLTAEQLANGTPDDKRIILKSFFKDDKATIAPAKDINGRYIGIQENIPEIKKLEMGYVPSIESKMKIYDGMEIDLNNQTWARDWEWMQHCREIAEDFATGQSSPHAYFYIFRPGFESAKKISDLESKVKLMNYVLQDSAENLYNRAIILGIDMSDSVISDVKEYLLGLVETEPEKLITVYESKTFSLELLLMHALKKGVLMERGGTYTFGEMLLGVDKSAVISYFSNPKNHQTVSVIESLTYGKQTKAKNPLENEAVGGYDDHENLLDAGTDGIITEGIGNVIDADDMKTNAKVQADAQDKAQDAAQEVKSQKPADIAKKARQAAAKKSK